MPYLLEDDGFILMSFNLPVNSGDNHMYLKAPENLLAFAPFEVSYIKRAIEREIFYRRFEQVVESVAKALLRSFPYFLL